MILEKQRDKSRQKKNAGLKFAQKSWFEEDGLIPLFDVFQTSWESKGTPPMPPPQEIRPY